jgi:hypothetical protein
MSTQPVPTFYIGYIENTFDKFVSDTLAGEGVYVDTYNWYKELEHISADPIGGEFTKFVNDEDVLTEDWADIKKLESICKDTSYSDHIRKLADILAGSILYNKFYLPRLS